MSAQNWARHMGEALEDGFPVLVPDDGTLELDIADTKSVTVRPKTVNEGSLKLGTASLYFDTIVIAGAAGTITHDGSADSLALVDTDLSLTGAAGSVVYNDANDTFTLTDTDLVVTGSLATSYLELDSSADQISLFGAMRPRGFNALSPRFELKWVAGQRGKPGVNGDIQSATESVREIADPDFELLGTNAVSSTSAYYAEGGLVLTTTTGSADQVIIVPHLDTAQSPWTGITWGTDQETEWECLIQTAASIADVTIWAGLKLTNTSVTATDDDQAFFRYQNGVNSGNWQAISSNNGTDDAHDAGVAVAADTTYHLKITIDSSRVARFYINGALVETSAALADAHDLIPYIGVQTGTTAAKELRVFGQAISRNAGA